MLKHCSRNIALLYLCVASSALAAPQYVAQKLSPLPGYQFDKPTMINDSGEIVGTSWNSSGSSVTTTWVNLNPAPTTAWPAGNPGSFAVALDNTGDILGASNEFAYVYQNGWYHILLDQSYSSYDLTGIINGGKVVNNYTDASGNPAITIWDTNGISYTQPFQNYSPGSGTVADAVSSAGYIVGAFYYYSDAAFVADPTGGISLLIDGSGAIPTAINNRGAVSGLVRIDGTLYPAIWIDNSPEILPDLSDDYPTAWPAALNESDIIVGQSFGDSNNVAVVWIDGAIYDLNGLVDSNLNLLGAVSINSSGDILAYSGDEYGNAEQAYLLTPIPEPALLILALWLPMFRRALPKLRYR